jgi:large subunit ribosomal protein L30
MTAETTKKTTKKPAKKADVKPAVKKTATKTAASSTKKPASSTKKPTSSAKKPATRAKKPATRAKEKAKGQLRITQVKSQIGYAENQRRVLAGLGLGRIGRTVVRPDDVCIRGMVAKVTHLVSVDEVEG